MSRLSMAGFVVLVVAVGVAVLEAPKQPAAIATQTTPNVPSTVAAQVQATTVAASVRATLSAATPTALPNALHPAIGEVGYLYALTTSGAPIDEVPVSGSAAQFASYVKSVRAHDDVGLRDLLDTYQLITVRAGTKARVIDAAVNLLDVDVAEVRFVDGPWATTTAWLDHTWIVSQLPTNFVPPTPSTG